MLDDIKKTLWATADKLRANMDAAEYKHLVLGLIFVKYISDTFAARRAELTKRLTNPADEYFFHDAQPGDIEAELEDRDYYREVNVFWVPETARWESLRSAAKQSDIGKRIDDALAVIETENPKLKGILDKRYARAQLTALYLSSTKETAMSEVRPWLTAEISCAKFRTTRDLKIVDCSVHANKNLLGWDAASPEDIQEAVWASIDRGFSRPVASAAGSTEYIPTQILSELFKSLGLDGVGYRSALHDGYNLALFNVDMAEMVDCQLFDTKRIDYEFSEASTVFRDQKA